MAPGAAVSQIPALALAALGKLTAKLVGGDTDAREAFREVGETVCDVLNADGCAIWGIDVAETTLQLEGQVIRQGTPFPDHHRITLPPHDPWIGALRQNHVLAFSTSGTKPIRGAQQTTPSGADSVIQVAIFLGGTIGGILTCWLLKAPGTDSLPGRRGWEPEALQFASACADFIGAAMARTDQAMLQATLNESERQFRLVAENMRDLVCVHDIEGHFLWASPSADRVLGHPPRKLLGRDLFAFVHPDDEEAVRTKLWDPVCQDGWGAPLEYRAIRADGTETWLETVAQRALRDDGQAYIQTSSRVIDDRRRADALERARAVALELVAKNHSIDTVLRHLVNMVENQRPNIRCSILLEPESRSTVTDPSAHSFASAPFRALTGDTIAMPIQTSSGDYLGLFAGHSSTGAQGLTEEDYSLMRAATKLASIALEQHRLTNRLSHQAQHDMLTGLPNRRLFDDRLTQAISTANRHQAKVAVLFIDLDGFKRINDTLGHARGDLLLREVSRRLKAIVRITDTVARMGGDEFAVILTDAHTNHAPMRSSTEILASLKAPFFIEGQEICVTASVGIALYPQDAADSSTLLQFADTAMYRAKTNGRDGYHFFTEELHGQVAERVELEAGLRRAEERNELALEYQVEVAGDGSVLGVEALVRWDHKERGRIGPARFIPIAEESGLIVSIGNWVFRAALEQLGRWQQERNTPFKLGVNVSPVQFRRPDFVATLSEMLVQSKVDPRGLEIELTEGILMEDFEAASAKLLQLRALGVTVAVDDFGTGYSSLSYLHRLPIDTLKIDQSFIRDLHKPTGPRSLVEAIIALARRLNLSVVAEGVELESQADILKELGCDRLQGYLFGRPLPASQVGLRVAGRAA
jgi:diguanylate cyclase (GGDEF)-like protein/PAS domain S-box-containing protein